MTGPALAPWKDLGTWLRTSLVVILIGAISGIITITDWAVHRWPEGPPRPLRLTADLNIVVARFEGTVNDDISAGLDTALLDTIKQDLTDLDGKGLSTAFEGPDRAQLTAVPRDREAAMANLASKTNATLVISGEVMHSDDSFRLIPEIYLSSSKVPDAEELSGRHTLPETTVPAEQASLPTARLLLRNAVALKAAALAHFVLAIGFYLQHDMTAATSELKVAQKDSEGDISTWAIVQLFLGNVEAKAGNYSQAEDHYDRAVEGGSMARGRLGLIEVAYQRSRGECRKGSIDVAGLTNVQREFAELSQEGTIAASAILRARVLYSMGQSYVCLSQAEYIDGWPEAESDFKSVIRSYAEGNSMIRNLAAESWAGLALVYSPPATALAAMRRDSYSRVAAAYEEAVKLTDDSQRRELFQTLLDEARHDAQLGGVDA